MWLLPLIVLLAGTNAQYITTKSLDVTKTEGTSLDLPCYVQDFDEEDSIIWQRNNEPLFINEEQMEADDRYFVTFEKNNSTLTIKSLEPMDSGKFVCMITMPKQQQVVHQIEVQTKPVVHLTPHEHSLDVNAGEKNVIVRCHVRGNPPPHVTWERKGGLMPAGVTLHHHQLILDTANTKHTGEYTCKATNDAGSDSAFIKINVNEYDSTATEIKPWTKMDKTFIAVKLRAEVELECVYDGYPVPQIEWKLNGFKINFNDENFKNIGQQATRQHQQTVNKLSIINITEDQFGDYTCRASNKLGSHHSVVHVSGRPGPPVLAEDGYRLSWKVDSGDEVIEYKVHYRLAKQDGWVNYKEIRAKKADRTPETHTYEKEIDLTEFLTPGVKYELQVNARNPLGWGSFAHDFVTVEIPADHGVKSMSTVISLLVPFYVAILRWV